MSQDDQIADGRKAHFLLINDAMEEIRAPRPLRTQYEEFAAPWGGQFLPKLPQQIDIILQPDKC